jgi:hypothetical protein
MQPMAQSSEKRKEQMREYMRGYTRKPYNRDKEKQREACRKWERKVHERDPEANSLRKRRALLKHRYGITLEEFNALLAKQNSRCAICCLSDNVVWHIDHCHVSGKFRGVLCSQCNKGLGHFKDSLILLLAAVKYLEEETDDNPQR